MLLLANATIIDGTGLAPFLGHVLITGDSIDGVYALDDEPTLAARIASLATAGESFVNHDCTGKYMLPGFVDLLIHISIASDINPNPILINDYSPLFTDFVLSPAYAPGSTARLEKMLSLQRSALLTGVTTFVDSVSAIFDVERVATILANEPAGLYPNFYSLGPIISPTNSHPFPIDGTPYKYEIDVSLSPDELRERLQIDLASWFVQPILSETMLGTKVCTF